MVRLSTFYDPDGTPWMLAQTLDRKETRGGQISGGQHDGAIGPFGRLRRAQSARRSRSDDGRALQARYLAYLEELSWRRAELVGARLTGSRTSGE